MENLQSLDAITRQAIDDRIKSETQLQGTPDEVLGGFTAESAKPFLTENDIAKSAIQSKANKLFQNDLASLQARKRMDNFEERAKNLNRTKRFGIGQLRADQTYAAAMEQRRMNEEAQRAQILTTILGIGGAAAGAVLGGMPGAAAGGAAGSAVGNMGSRRQSNPGVG